MGKNDAQVKKYLNQVQKRVALILPADGEDEMFKYNARNSILYWVEISFHPNFVRLTLLGPAIMTVTYDNV